MIKIKNLTVKNFMSVDQIVTDQLTNIESEFYDTKLLLKIYQNL
jgi:hypothetical protein